MTTPIFALRAAALACVALFAGCGGDDDDSLPQLPPATGAALTSCSGLAAAFQFANTTIASAEQVAAGTLSWGGTSIAAHCLVKGEMYARTSPQDGLRYAIGFEMRLPQDWNGRFFYQANGGSDGLVKTAYGVEGHLPFATAPSSRASRPSAPTPGTRAKET